MKERIEKTLVLGDGMEANVNQGPLINDNQFKKVVSYVEDAKTKGAKVVMGGTPDERGGLFYKPTILTDVNPAMELYQDEIFGPVISIMRFKEEKVSTYRLPMHRRRYSDCH